MVALLLQEIVVCPFAAELASFAIRITILLSAENAETLPAKLEMTACMVAQMTVQTLSGIHDFFYCCSPTM